jgi:chlorite dismutase
MQAHAPYSEDGAFSEGPEMTEEERQEAEADRLKALIQQTQMETEDSADRSLQMMYEANQRMDYMLQDFQNQEERLDNAERNLGATRKSSRHVSLEYVG